jgi:hypothetical protein
MSIFSGCPGAVSIREAQPEDIQCTKCGAEVEIWSEELCAIGAIARPFEIILADGSHHSTR